MKRNGMDRDTVVVIIPVLILGIWAAVFAGKPRTTEIALVSKTVRDYMEAIDSGDLDRQMGYWSQDASVTSIIMGEIWQGQVNIRARSAEYVPVSKIMRNELGEVKVVPLGVDSAFAILPFRAVRRNPEDEKLKPYELESLLTLILKRNPGGWRIIHEHVSVKVPPPLTKKS